MMTTRRLLVLVALALAVPGPRLSGQTASPGTGVFSIHGSAFINGVGPSISFRAPADVAGEGSSDINVWGALIPGGYGGVAVDFLFRRDAFRIGPGFGLFFDDNDFLAGPGIVLGLVTPASRQAAGPHWSFLYHHYITGGGLPVFSVGVGWVVGRERGGS